MSQRIPLFLFTFLSLALGAAPANAAELSYYLPKDIKYDPSIPKPKETLGWTVGEWHVRHDQMAAYMKPDLEIVDGQVVREDGDTTPFIVISFEHYLDLLALVHR